MGARSSDRRRWAGRTLRKGATPDFLALRSNRSSRFARAADFLQSIRTLPSRILRGDRTWASRPALTVVIPVYNVEDYLPACLDSVLGQDLNSLEVIVVDDGSTDRSPEILASYAARDHRIRAFAQVNAGQGPARNLGVLHARGQFLTFVDSDDVVPPGALRGMLRTIRRSGSDFVVGGVRRLERGEYSRPSWSGVVHEHDRTAVSIDDFPAALADVVAHHRMFRRAFWTSEVGEFAPGVYEDHVPMVAAYLRARTFDVLARPTYDWRMREDGTSTGQQKHSLPNLVQRIAVKAEARKLVWREASPEVRAAWVGRVLDIDLPPFIDHALRSTDEYRDVLQRALALHIGEMTDAARPYVRVQQKVRTYLASRGAWADLERAQQLFAELGSVPPTSVRDGRLVIDTDLAQRLDTPLPAEVLELGRGESRLQACAMRARVVDATSLELTAWALIRGLDLSLCQPTIELWLAEKNGSERVDLPVEGVELREATVWARWPHGSFARAGFRTRIDLAALASLGPGAEWRAAVRVTVDGITREGGLHHALAGSSASRAAIRMHRIESEGRVAQLRFDNEHGLTVSVTSAVASPAPLAVPEQTPHTVQVTDVAVKADALTIEANLPKAAHADGDELRVRLAHDTQEVAAENVILDEGRLRAVIRLHSGGRALQSGDWVLRIGTTDRPDRQVEAAPILAVRLPLEAVVRTHRLRVALAGARELRIGLSAPLVDEEASPYGQRQLQLAYAAGRWPLGERVLFVPRDPGEAELLQAVQREVRARHGGLPTLWGIPDLSTAVPRGARPVIAGSREWYMLLAATERVVTDADLDRYVRRRPHQRIVRLFGDHDLPIGRTAWWAEGWTPGRIAAEVERLNALWTAVAVPTAPGVEWCRAELGYTGPIAVGGADSIGEIVDVVLARPN